MSGSCLHVSEGKIWPTTRAFIMNPSLKYLVNTGVIFPSYNCFTISKDSLEGELNKCTEILLDSLPTSLWLEFQCVWTHYQQRSTLYFSALDKIDFQRPLWHCNHCRKPLFVHSFPIQYLIEEKVCRGDTFWVAFQCRKFPLDTGIHHNLEEGRTARLPPLPPNIISELIRFASLLFYSC